MSALHEESASPLSVQLLLRSGANLLTSLTLSFKSRGVVISRRRVFLEEIMGLTRLVMIDSDSV